MLAAQTPFLLLRPSDPPGAGGGGAEARGEARRRNMPGLVTSSATGNPAGGTPAPRLNLKFSRPFGPRCGWGAKPGVETPGYSRVVPVGTKWPGDKSAHIPVCSPGRERLEIFSRIAPMKLCGRAFGVRGQVRAFERGPALAGSPRPKAAACRRTPKAGATPDEESPGYD